MASSDYALPINLDLQKQCEQALIGAAITSYSPEIKHIVSILEPKHFYSGIHKSIWKIIKEFSAKDQFPNLIMVTREAVKLGLVKEVPNFTSYLMDLNGRLDSIATVISHATFLMEYYFRYHLHKIMIRYTNRTADPGVDIISAHIALKKESDALYLHCLTNIKKINQSSSSSMSEVIENELQQIEKDLISKDVAGIPYGVAGIDEKADMMMPGNFIVVGSRPGMGKSVFALQIALHAAIVLNKKVDFHSLEMTKSEVAHRVIAMYTDYSIKQLLYRNVVDSDIASIRKLMKSRVNSNLEIYDDAEVTVDQMGLISSNRGSDMMILDYLQLTEGERSGSREQDVSRISRSLKKIAMNQKIPVIALSQLSREVEKRHGTNVKNPYRPILSDLRESGSIEQDANTIIFLFRPSEYKLSVEGMPENIAEINFAKQRNGSKPVVLALFDTKTYQFTKYQQENEKTNQTNNYGGDPDEVF